MCRWSFFLLWLSYNIIWWVIVCIGGESAGEEENEGKCIYCYHCLVAWFIYKIKAVRLLVRLSLCVCVVFVLLSAYDVVSV